MGKGYKCEQINPLFRVSIPLVMLEFLVQLTSIAKTVSVAAAWRALFRSVLEPNVAGDIGSLAQVLG